jgi:hypothetical protein
VARRGKRRRGGRRGRLLIEERGGLRGGLLIEEREERETINRLYF